MQVSIEAFVGINVVMNTMLLGVIARSRGALSPGRVLFAAAFGALYAVAMQTETFYLLRYGVARFLLAGAMTLIAIPADSFRAWFQTTALFIASTMFLGAAVTMAYGQFGRTGQTLAAAGAIGGIVLTWAWQARARRIERFEARLYIEWRGRATRLNALIDTGNHLREPISQLPVMVVEEALLRPLVPLGLAQRAKATLPAGFRLVAYDGLSGCGQLPCFRPDRIYATYGAGWLRAPDMYVALYPGKMPGVARALAPPVIGSVQHGKNPWNRRLDRWSIRQVR